MAIDKMNILLADDDEDDCVFFKEALEGITISTNLFTVNDGEELMLLLTNDTKIVPYVLFLDINMPKKNGFECLQEIKKNSKLQSLPVIMFSTSLEEGVVNQLYLDGANYFIRKPDNFSEWIRIIKYTLELVQQKTNVQTSRDHFVLSMNRKAVEK